MLGKLIKEYLKNKGLTQKFIAANTDMSEQKISAMLNEKQKIIAEDLFLICKVLNVPIEMFDITKEADQ
jgi:transcriptional regulator with XRE-family HTH domain